MSEQWGPWIDHDLNGCPVSSGVIVEIEWMFEGVKNIGKFLMGTTLAVEHWNESDKASRELVMLGVYDTRIIRYRIRKPKGLHILEALLQDLPEYVDA